ncbi:MAG: hypothetical protein IIA67_08340, partial [Planctomycetes bacterium]|nr:hypothetical protein [Planctomycetota bacterium]
MLPTLARTTKVSARYEHFWTVYSAPVRLSCVVLLGMALFFVGGMLRQASTTWRARIAVWAALTVAAAIVWRLFAFSVTALSTRDPTAMSYAFSAYLGAIGLLLAAALFATRRYGIAPLQWKSWLEKATLFLSPMPVIFWVNMFLVPT